MTRAAAWLALVAACGSSPAGLPDAEPGDGHDAPGDITRDADAQPQLRGGPVRLSDHSLEDDHGRFNALGATMMWAAWAYRNDRFRLETQLAYLRDHGFHFIRALGIVGNPAGPDYWDGREIELGWSDYDDVIAGPTDLAYDQYGLRVEWTLIGDGQYQVPTDGQVRDLIDRFIAMSAPRREKIIHFELANEYYQNGFGGDDGIARLRDLTGYLRDRTDILVAASAPYSSDCETINEVYSGGVADLATIHFDRTNNTNEGNWRPIRQPWEYEACDGALPVGSNNEPIGPGSSVTTVTQLPPLVAAPLVTWLSSIPLHVFHSRAGVRGDEGFETMLGANAQRHLMALVPGGVASWTRRDCRDPDAPFRCYARDGGAWVADAMWPELGNATGGATAVYTAVSGNDYFTVAIGVRAELQLEARRALTVQVIDPTTGDTIATHAPGAGAMFMVGDGREVLILRGQYQ